MEREIYREIETPSSRKLSLHRRKIGNVYCEHGLMTMVTKVSVIYLTASISEAFDNVLHVCWARHRVEGVNNTIVRWMGEMLTTRTTETIVGNQATTLRTTRGTPQGGVT